MFSTVFSIGDHLKYFSDYSDLVFDIDLDVDGLPAIMEEVHTVGEVIQLLRWH